MEIITGITKFSFCWTPFNCFFCQLPAWKCSSRIIIYFFTTSLFKLCSSFFSLFLSIFIRYSKAYVH